MTMNNKGNMDDHIKKIKGKTEAALQMIFTLAGNEEFHNIEMSTIWKLLDTCIIPIITYGAEAWTTTKAEENALHKILDNIIKRIMKTPTTTPSELTTSETGIWDIETQVMRTQIMYYHKIVNTRPKESTLYKVTTDPDNPWKKKITNTLMKINITETEFLEKKKTKKTIATQKLNEYQINKIYKAADNKSKVMDYVWNKTRETICKKPTYMNNITRRECTNIFAVRSRMLKVKGNYKNKYTDKTCRWCKDNMETQEHILKQCAEFKHITQNITYETYFDDDTNMTKIAAETIHNVITKLSGLD